MSAFSKRQYEFLSNWARVTHQPASTIHSLMIWLRSDNENFDPDRFVREATKNLVKS